MACNIASILSGDLKELKNTQFKDDSLLNRIKETAGGINKLDCPEIVYNYFNKLSGGTLGSVSSVMSATEGYLDLSNTMKTLANYVMTPTANEFVQTFCLTINGYYKTIIDIIEKAIKLVPEWFKKIDQLVAEVERFIKKIALDIKDCVLSVLDAVQKKLNDLAKSLTINYDDIFDFMNTCPCATEALGALFKCSNKTPSGVVDCLKNKLSLDATDAMKIINRFFENTLKANVLLAYKMIERAIKNVFEYVMSPLRSLVKKYCQLLNKKFDITKIIKALGPAECFFVYTRESKKIAGIATTYYGMSVLDALKTLKSWADCFDGVCSWSNDIALKIKSYNEKLRLAPRFWTSTYTVDIFNACIAKGSGTTTSATSTRELFVTQQNQSKNNLIDLYDTVKQIRKMIVVNYNPYDDIGGTAAQSIAPDPESSTGLFENNIGNQKEFYSGVDDVLIKLVENISAGLKYNDSYYRIYQQLRTLSSGFNKSKKLSESLQYVEYLNGTERLKNDDYTELLTPLNDDVEPFYKQKNEGDILQFNNKPVFDSGEQLTTYYEKWFALNI